MTLATQMMMRLPVTAKMLRPCAHLPSSTKRNTELSSKIWSRISAARHMTTAKTPSRPRSTLKSFCSGVLSSQWMKELRQRLAAASVFFTEPSGMTTSTMGLPYFFPSGFSRRACRHCRCRDRGRA